MVLRVTSLKMKLGLVFLFFIKPPLKSSPNDKMLPSFKRGGIIPTHISSQTLEPLFLWVFGDTLQWEVAVA